MADAETARAQANLRSTLSHLKSLGIPLLTSRESVQRSTDVDVDIDQVQALSLATTAVSTADLAVAGVLAGDLLPDWDESWLEVERERYRQLRLHLLERTCEGYAAQREFAMAIELCTLAVGEDPLRETAQALLMRVHLAEGNRSEAIRRFEAYRRLLWEELGLEAARDIEAVIDAARQRNWGRMRTDQP